VRASDAILSTRIFQVLVREGLPLPGFDERRWGELYAAAAIPFDDQVGHFALRRAERVGVLRSLTADEWLRSGEHEQLGTLTVADICQKIIEHEAEHRAQLDRIVAGGRGAMTDQFGCGYCRDSQNRFYGHVTQISSNEERGMILLRCARCDALYENTLRGPDRTRRLSDEEAARLFPDYESRT
jgi:DinB family protein